MSEPRFDALIEDLKAEFLKRGISNFVFMVSDPDSDLYGGQHKGSTCWVVGAMDIYSHNLKVGTE